MRLNVFVSNESQKPELTPSVWHVLRINFAGLFQSCFDSICHQEKPQNIHDKSKNNVWWHSRFQHTSIILQELRWIHSNIRITDSLIVVITSLHTIASATDTIFSQQFNHPTTFSADAHVKLTVYEPIRLLNSYHHLTSRWTSQQPPMEWQRGRLEWLHQFKSIPNWVLCLKLQHYATPTVWC